MKPTLYYDGSYSLDLSQIKAIKKDYDTKSIVFEFKTRAEFGINPFTETEEMIMVSVTPVATMPYSSTDSMNAYYEEVVEAWKEYLIESTQKY